MATWYFYLDATGNADGTSEANAYDGTSTVTLPDGSSAVCRINNIVGVMPPGDILYVKKSDDEITWHGSVTTGVNANDGPTAFSQGYGPVRVIGYGSTVTDGIRPTISMGGTTWRFYRRCGLIANFNFHGTYTGTGLIIVDEGALISNCRIHNTNSGSAAPALSLYSQGNADRCEIIADYSIADPSSSYTSSVVYLYPSVNSTITNCYIEGRNGANGIWVRRRSGSMIIANNIINVNLDVDGAGHSNASGIRVESYGYLLAGTIINNIIHNAENGIYMDRTSSDDRSAGSIIGNIISSCAKAIDGDDHYNAKINALDTAIDDPVTSANNIFYANTANSFLNSERNPLYLTSDPFVAAASKDFTITGSTVLTSFGYASNFSGQTGASGDTITENALVPLKPTADVTLPTIVSFF